MQSFIEHDDVLSPFALAEIALALNADPEANLVDADEDELSEDGTAWSLGYSDPTGRQTVCLAGTAW